MDWEPKVRVGPFIFGDEISRYMDTHGLIPSVSVFAQLFNINWESYDTPDYQIQIRASGGIIETVGCFKTCQYRDFNLIGATFKEAIDHLSCSPGKHGEVREIAGELQTKAQFDDLCLELWLRPNNVISAAFCGSY